MEKKVLKAGNGLYCPNQQTSVVVNLLGKWRTVDGIEQAFDNRKNQSIRIDEATCPLSQALEDVICSMKDGEECEVKFKMDDTLSTSPLLKDVPKDSLVAYTIHLVSFERAPEVWTLTEHSCERIALWHKTKGTELFKADNIYGASLHYSKALKYVVSVDRGVTDRELIWTNVLEEKVDVLVLKKPLLLNLAACQLKLKQYGNVVQNCSYVLDDDGLNVKALYRRGQALAAMNDFDSAKKDFLKVLEIEPNNTAVHKQLKELEVKVRTHKSKYREALKGMFN